MTKQTEALKQGKVPVKQAYQATPHSVLISELMNRNVPKTEREWAAVREIEACQEALAQPEQEPVLMMNAVGNTETVWPKYGHPQSKGFDTPLYTAPQPKDLAMVPLTVWQPIETAPKDNKRDLYLARLNSEGGILELDFNGAWEYWEESWELRHINGHAWVSNNGIEEPTHWAYQDEPLPKYGAIEAELNKGGL